MSSDLNLLTITVFPFRRIIFPHTPVMDAVYRTPPPLLSAHREFSKRPTNKIKRASVNIPATWRFLFLLRIPLSYEVYYTLRSHATPLRRGTTPGKYDYAKRHPVPVPHPRKIWSYVSRHTYVFTSYVRQIPKNTPFLRSRGKKKPPRPRALP